MLPSLYLILCEVVEKTEHYLVYPVFVAVGNKEISPTLYQLWVTEEVTDGLKGRTKAQSHTGVMLL